MPRMSQSKIYLNKNEVGIFGFGSLLSVTSLQQTLGRTYEKHQLSCTITGCRRRDRT